MKPDPIYIKRILDAFVASADWHTDIDVLQTKGINCQSQEFIFHLHLLVDLGLVQGVDNGSLGVHMNRGRPSGLLAVPLRLTAKGHDFEAALIEPTVFELIKNSMPVSGLGIAVDVGKTLLTQYVSLKLNLPNL